MSAHKGLLKQSVFAVIARFTGVGLNLGLQILVARLLTLGHYGDLKMLITLVIGVALFSRVGVEQLLVKEIASVEKNQQAFGAQFLTRSYLLVFFTSLLFVLAWAGVSPLLKDTFFGEITLTNLIIAGIGIFFFNLVTINAFYFKALRMSSASSLIQNALPAVSFMLLILLFWRYFPSNQLYLNIYTASTVLAGIASMLIVLPWTHRQATRQANVPTLKQLLQRSLPLAPVSIFSFLMLWSDTLMVGAFLSNEEVGLYSTAAAISFLSLFFLGALDATIYPRLLNISRNQPQRFVSFFWKSTVLVITGLLLVTIMMSVLAKPALWLFGPQFQQAHGVLLVLLLAQWFRATSLTFSFLFIIKERVKYLNIILVIALLINLLVNYLLIPQHGMMGAAIATLLANGFLAGFIILLFYRQKLLADYQSTKST